MSGVKRNILADLANEGATGEEAMNRLSPEAMRAEAGTAGEERAER